MYLTSHDHEVKGLYDFMGGSSSLYVTTLPSLVAKGIVIGSCDFMDWIP